MRILKELKDLTVEDTLEEAPQVNFKKAWKKINQASEKVSTARDDLYTVKRDIKNLGFLSDYTKIEKLLQQADDALEDLAMRESNMDYG